MPRQRLHSQTVFRSNSLLPISLSTLIIFAAKVRDAFRPHITLFTEKRISFTGRKETAPESKIAIC